MRIAMIILKQILKWIFYLCSPFVGILEIIKSLVAFVIRGLGVLMILMIFFNREFGLLLFIMGVIFMTAAFIVEKSGDLLLGLYYWLEEKTTGEQYTNTYDEDIPVYQENNIHFHFHENEKQKSVHPEIIDVDCTIKDTGHE